MKSLAAIAAQAAALLALASGAGALVKAFHPNAPALYLQEEPLGKNEVTLEIIRGWGAPPLWIDARQREAYGEDHIPGALLINEQEFDELILEAIEPLGQAQVEGRNIVVYCGSHGCKASHKVAEELSARRGLGDQVFVLRRGWKAWIEDRDGR